jgi:2-polyprenyl-3-methyl-5-hydroxy-6-metoxy-1,4-benzoquinol methylase
MKTLEREAPPAEWNRLYSRGKTPWRSSGLTGPTRRLLSMYAGGRRLLEVGCGMGDDSDAIVKMGFDYLGLDVADAAIRNIKTRRNGTAPEFTSADFFRWSSDKRFDVVYEKGFFHGLAGVRRRKNFLRRVAWSLAPQGIWVSVSGSADPNRCEDLPHGAIFLRDLVEPAEVYFEVLEIVKDDYGLADGANDFKAWHTVCRRL